MGAKDAIDWLKEKSKQVKDSFGTGIEAFKVNAEQMMGNIGPGKKISILKG